jgi:hypothetical protein
MVSPWQGMTIPIAIADDITPLSVGCNAEGTRLDHSRDLIRLRAITTTLTLDGVENKWIQSQIEAAIDTDACSLCSKSV